MTSRLSPYVDTQFPCTDWVRTQLIYLLAQVHSQGGSFITYLHELYYHYASDNSVRLCVYMACTGIYNVQCGLLGIFVKELSTSCLCM